MQTSTRKREEHFRSSRRRNKTKEISGQGERGKSQKSTTHCKKLKILKMFDFLNSNYCLQTQAKSNLMKATVEMSRVVKGLEEQIDSFEKQKLHDVKTILLNFVMIQLSYHAKAVELFTKAYQDVAEINEAQDLEVFTMNV